MHNQTNKRRPRSHDPNPAPAPSPLKKPRTLPSPSEGPERKGAAHNGKGAAKAKNSSAKRQPTKHNVKAKTGEKKQKSSMGLEWILHPMQPSKFFGEYWERRPLLIKRSSPDYYASLFSLEKMMQVVKERELTYGKNINVAIYQDGRKIDQNPEGIAEVTDIKKLWQGGSTFQVLHPQQYTDKMWEVCSAMEDQFGCLVGANAYLTPPSSQGLAPHFDDVEVFILQLEGKKHWTLHESEMALPREYSPDLTEESLPPPLMEVDLEAGDLLYFPRGTIHYARTFPDVHSTHMTVSTYQTWTWFDFLQRSLPSALEQAFQSDQEFREGLPVNFLSFMGTAHDPETLESDDEEHQAAKSNTKKPALNVKSNQQKQFAERFSRLVQKIAEGVDLHGAATDMTLDFNAHRIPPYRPTTEIPNPAKLLTIIDDEEEAEAILEGAPLQYLTSPMPTGDDTLIRLKNPDWLQMVVSDEDEDDCCASGDCEEDCEHNDENEEEDESDKKGKQKIGHEKHAKPADQENSDEESDDEGQEPSLQLFHCLHNSREHHMDGNFTSNPACIPLPLHHGPAIAYLVQQYPAFVPVSALPDIVDPKERFSLALALWQQGLLDTGK